MPASPDSWPTLRIVGALHIDEVATVQGRFVPAASNPVAWRRYVGGVGSNAARAAQALFCIKAAKCSARFHAAVGDDSAGKSLLNAIEREGLCIEPQFIKDQSTGRYSVVVDEAGQLVVGLADVQLAEHLQPASILSTITPELTNRVLLDANLSPTCIQALIEAASSSSIPIAALTVSPSKAVRFLPWANNIDLLFCNRREAMAMAIESNLMPITTQADQLPLQHLADALVEIGFNDFVLTDAASTLLIRCQSTFTGIQVPPVKVDNNVNGAGDTLAGASVAALSMGMSLEYAVSEFGLSLAADVLAGRRLPLPL